MNYYEADQSKKPLAPVMKYILSLLLGALASFFVPAAPLFFLFAGLFGAVYFCWGKGPFAVAAAGLIAGACLFAFDSFSTTVACVTVLLTGALLGIGLEKKLPYRSLVVIISLLFGVTLYVLMAKAGKEVGDSVFAAVQALVDGFVQQLLAMAGQSYLPTDERMVYLKEVFAKLSADVPTMVMTGIAIFAMGTAGIVVLTSRGIANRTGADIKPMAQLKHWQLSKGFLTGALIFGLGAVILNLTEVSYEKIATSMLLTIFLAQLVLMGVATFDFIASVRPKKRARFWVLGILACILFLGYAVYFFAFLGLMDRMTKFRKRVRIKPTDA